MDAFDWKFVLHDIFSIEKVPPAKNNEALGVSYFIIREALFSTLFHKQVLLTKNCVARNAQSNTSRQHINGNKPTGQDTNP